MPVNVLFLHAGGDWIRGSENALLTLLRGVDRSRIRPLLFSSNQRLVSAAQADGVETVHHPMPEIMIDGAAVQLGVFQWIKTLWKLIALVRQRNIQIVYCNGGSTSQVGYYLGKLRGVPVIAHLHSPYNRRYILLYRLHRVRRVIFVSHAIARAIRLKQRFAGQCGIVHNGVDLIRFSPPAERDPKWKEQLELPADSIVFGQVSSLITRKGIDILLRAFQLVHQRYPETRLVLVGGGPDRDRFVELATTLGVAAYTRFVGDQTDPLPYYQHVFDVNVLASRSDAFPLSPLEASACALPNIGANCGGIPEGISEPGTGYLFEPENHHMLADMMSLLAAAPDLRKSQGQAGRRLAEGQFSMDKYCSSIERILLDLGAVVGQRAGSLTADVDG